MIRFGAGLCGAIPAVVGLYVAFGWMFKSHSIVTAVKWSPLMVANTAICTALTGVGIAALALRHRVASRVAAGVGGAGAAITVVTLIEWMFQINLGIDELIIGAFTEVGQDVRGRMSPYTAITLGILGLSVLYMGLTQRNRRWPLIVPATLAAVAAAIATTVLVGYVFDYQLPLASTMAVHTAGSIFILSVGIFGIIHAATYTEVSTQRWIIGPLITYTVITAMMIWFGFLVRRFEAGALSIIAISQIIAMATICFAVACAVAAHFLHYERIYRQQQQQVTQEFAELNDSLERRIAERTQHLETQRTRLRTMTQQLAVVEQQERRRLAGELHDYLAQLLVVTKMTLDKAQDQAGQTNIEPLLKHATGVLDDCIDYARDLTSNIAPTTLFDIGLLAAIQTLADQMTPNGLTVRVTVEGDEPDYISEGASILLYQATRELLINCLKHAEVDHALVNIRISDIDVQITVSDKGRGFDPVAEKQRTEGGFGLFNIEQRIDSAGGHMDIESAPDQGVRITILLPIASQPHETTEAPQPLAEAPPLKPASRVMLVDDHRLVREGIRSLIEERCDLTVVAEADDGVKAVEMARTAQPDVIIMDINMPNMNGIEATRRIKSEQPNIIIIAVTMSDDDESRKAISNAGADAFVSKADITSDLCDVLYKVSAVQPQTANGV